MKLLIASTAMMLLLPATVLAGGVPLDQVPLFWGATGQNPKYHDAAFKAQEAFLVQSGIGPAVNKVSDIVTGTVKNRVTAVAEKVIPFPTRGIAAVVGTVYTVGVKKQVNYTFANPLVRAISHAISMSPDGGSITTSVAF